MKPLMVAVSLMLYVGLVAVVNGKDTAGPPALVVKEEHAPDFRYGGGNLNDSERAGAEIWFKATAGNERFFTYVYPQRIGVTIDWYRVLGTKSREQRFNRWGLINDPECCKPGDPDCPAKSEEDT